MEVSNLRIIVLDEVKRLDRDIQIMATQAVLEFEEMWREILQIQRLKAPCTMDSFDPICELSRFITQFCLENTTDPPLWAGVTLVDGSMSNIQRLQRIEKVLCILQSRLKRHYWKEVY